MYKKELDTPTGSISYELDFMPRRELVYHVVLTYKTVYFSYPVQLDLMFAMAGRLSEEEQGLEEFSDWFEVFFTEHMEPGIITYVVEWDAGRLNIQQPTKLDLYFPLGSLQQKLQSQCPFRLYIVDALLLPTKEKRDHEERDDPIPHLEAALRALGCAVVVVRPEDLKGISIEGMENSLKLNVP